MNHDAITDVITCKRTIPYGVGILPNPYLAQEPETVRRHQQAKSRKILTDKIEALYEPRFIAGPPVAECIEALIVMTDSRRILEIGCCTGYTTLHMLRAVIGKPDALVVSIDARPAHDANFWKQFYPTLQFVQGWTPDVLVQLTNNQIGYGWQFVFIDSDHSVEHTIKELEVLWPQTVTGTIFCFHDVPQWQTPQNRVPPPVREWLLRHPKLEGLCLPSCEQLDCLATYGQNYPKECNPGLGIFIRK